QVQATSASGLITAFVNSVPGLNAIDPGRVLEAYLQGQVTALSKQALSGADIESNIVATMNNPQGDPAALAVFDKVMPGYNQKIQNGSTNADGTYSGISGYIAYV